MSETWVVVMCGVVMATNVIDVILARRLYRRVGREFAARLNALEEYLENEDPVWAESVEHAINDLVDRVKRLEGSPAGSPPGAHDTTPG